MQRWFGYETYATDLAWCESQFGNDYKVLPYVAEFANSVSSLALVVFPLINLIQLRTYFVQLNPWALLPNLLLILNGLASAYYHATLSLAGQLADELLTLHILAAFTIAYLPMFCSALVPKPLRTHMTILRVGFLLLAVLITALCFLKPAMNGYALLLFSVPAVLVIYMENTGLPPCANKMTLRIFLIWTCALVCWFADLFACQIWLQLGIPYLHAVWHILAAYAGYNVFVMFTLLDIQRRATGLAFIVRFQYLGWTVPYLMVILDEDYKEAKCAEKLLESGIGPQLLNDENVVEASNGSDSQCCFSTKIVP